MEREGLGDLERLEFLTNLKKIMLKNFKVNIIVRVILLVLLTGGLVASIQARMDILAIVLLGSLSLLVASFIRYVNQTNRDLANFFTSVQYDDFTANTNSSLKGASFEDLYAGFNLVNRKFRDIRAEKEANHQFLQTIVKNIEVGLLCINEEGEVIVMNDALQSILHKSYLIHFDGLKKVDEKLWETVSKLQNGERALLKISIQNDLLQLSIHAVEMRMQSSDYRLITFQNIQNELEAQELQSWQKLIRILTHEIMNSVTPISSLSSTIHTWLNDQEQVSPEQLDQIRRSSAVIEKRSQGLLRFTETYRKLTRLPPPQFQSVDTQQLIETVVTLMQTTIDRKQIQLEQIYRNPVLKFNGDPNLLEQVLINILKNAIDAVAKVEDPKINIITFFTAKGKVCIKIIDNGPGVPPDKMEQIFIPFFTTKAEGSGIGLSLSRQIMRMHKGSIELKPNEGEGTVVTLLL